MISAGKKLKKAREAKGFTQRQLGSLMDVSQPLVAQIEANHRTAYPKFRRLAAKFLEVPEEDIFEVSAK